MALKSRVILMIFLQHQRPLPSVNENDIYDVSPKTKSGWVSLSSVHLRPLVQSCCVSWTRRDSTQQWPRCMKMMYIFSVFCTILHILKIIPPKKVFFLFSKEWINALPWNVILPILKKRIFGYIITKIKIYQSFTYASLVNTCSFEDGL